MLPTWVGVVMAVSLAIIALAALTVAAAITTTALGMQAALRALRDLAGPALDDARQMVATIRAEVDGLAETSRDLRGRIVRAADTVESRLALVNALLGGVQGSAQSIAVSIAATIRSLLRGVKMRRLKRGRKKK
jgi:uncharacterized protein YoxC